MAETQKTLQLAVGWLAFCLLPGATGADPAAPPPQGQAATDQELRSKAEQADKEAYALYLSNDYQGALRRLDEALTLYRRAGDPSGEVKVLNGMGLIHAQTNHYREAAALYAQAINLAGALKAGGHAPLVATLNNLGALYGETGEYRKGQETLLRALEIAAGDKDRVGEGAVRHSLGLLYSRGGEYKKAVESYEMALKIRRDEGHGNVFEVIVTLNNLGAAYAANGLTQEGLARLREALTEAQAVNRPQDGVKILNNVGRVYARVGQFVEAIKAYEAARRLNALHVSDPESELESLHGIGSVYVDSQKLNEALTCYQQAAELAPTTGDPRDRAASFQALGFIYDRLARFDDALANYALALEAWRSIGHRAGEAETLNSTGEVRRKRGQFSAALENYQVALGIAAEIGDRETQAIILNNMGETYRASGMYAKALQHHEDSLRLARAAGDRGVEEKTLGNIGGAYQSIGQPDVALGYYRQALALARETGNKADEATSLNNVGNIALIYSDLDAAFDNYTRALEIARSRGARPSEGVMLHNVAFVYFRRGQYDEALRTYQQALSLQREVGNRPVEAETLNNIGDTQTRLGRYEEALTSYGKALELRRAVGDRAGEGKTLGSIASLHEARGDLRQSQSFYREALDAWESVRAFASVEEFKTSVAEQFSDVYKRAVALSMRLKEPREAFELSERARARSFLDQLGQAHLDLLADADGDPEAQQILRQLRAVERTIREENTKLYGQVNQDAVAELNRQAGRLESEYRQLRPRIALRSPKYSMLAGVTTLDLPAVQRRLGEMRAALGKEPVLLSYFVTTNGVLAFVITPESFTAREVCGSECVDGGALSDAIKRFRDFANTAEPHPRTLQQLYKWLIAPLASDLKLNQLLVVVPHGVLHYLPFSALTNGQQYLIDHHPVSYLPSASALQFAKWERSPAQPSLLALVQARVLGLPFLRFADQTAADVARLHEHAEVLTDRAATEAALRQRAATSDIIFLAAHGQLNNNNPLFSRIFLAPGGDREADDGLLMVHEVYSLELSRANLVILGACKTQLGTRSRGDDIVGLHRAFSYAGAASTLASLWSVSEKQTGELIYAFFRHWRGGVSKAEAIRMAQREMREKYPHPYYWAAFVLTGDPGTSNLNTVQNH